MASQVYTIMYTGRVGTNFGGVELQFQQFARSLLNNVYCADASGKNTGLNITFDIVERHGPFGLVMLTINDATWAASKYDSAHNDQHLGRSEGIFASTPTQARTQAQAMRDAAKKIIDASGIPTASTEVQRVINYLRSLDLSGHHIGFEVVRQSYINTLSDQTGTGLHHWLYSVPLCKYDAATDGWAFAVDPVVVQEMVDEMNAVPITHPIQLMHYACTYGSFCAFFDFPVT